MTGLSLRNPIAILMLCIGLCVFAVVVTPRMSVDTFPELTPPVLVIGTQAPGLGPKDIEKTITWRLEKYVSATPGVDHVESISRNNLSIIYVWLKWGTNLNAAQTLVQQNVAFAMAAVPKSLGVLPPFVLQYDPSNAPVVQVTVSGGGLSGPQLYDYAFNSIEPILEGIPGVASASINGGRQSQINIVVDPVKAQALTSSQRPLSLQAPYVFNVALDLDYEETGTRARILYNLVGPRLTTVGADGIPDVYELAKHGLDITVGQKIGKHVEVRASATNLIDAPIKEVHDTESQQAVREEYTLGRTFNVGVALAY